MAIMLKVALSFGMFLAFMLTAFHFALLHAVISQFEAFLPLVAGLMVLLPNSPFQWIAKTFWRLGKILRSDYLQGSLCAILFVLPLFHSWSDNQVSLYTTRTMIGGIIPWNDAASYYQGAIKLLADGSLDSWNSRRPLNASFLSFRLFLTGLDLQKALILQAVLLGLAAFFAGKVVAKTFGPRIGVVFLFMVYSFGRLFVATTLSEALGLTFGLIAFSVLLDGFARTSCKMVGLGFFFLTVALNARAGAFFILPGLLLCILWIREWPWLRRGIGVSLAVAGIALGFFVNVALLKCLSGTGGLHSNFAYVLYGISAGGREWTSVNSDFPELAKLDEGAQAKFIFERAKENICQRPMQFFKGLLRGGVISAPAFVWNIGEMAFPFGPFRMERFIRIFRGAPRQPVSLEFLLVGSFFAIFSLLLAVRLWKSVRHSWAQIPVFSVLVGSFGVFLSFPVIYPDGQLRIMAPTFPFLAALIAFGILGQEVRRSGEESHHEQTPNYSRWNLALGTICLAGVFIGPIWGHAYGAHWFRIPELSGNPSASIAFVGPETPHINIFPDGQGKETLAPDWNESDFFQDPTFGGIEEREFLGKIVPPATLFCAPILGTGSESMALNYFAGPVDFIGSKWAPRSIETAEIASSVFFQVLVNK